MKTLKLKAPAKINLTLEVVKKLPNGYHELRTVMAKIGKIFDEIIIRFYPNKRNIVIKSDSKKIPLGSNNICYKAAEKYFAKIKERVGIAITIRKKIPVGAGLGGGSSDGASVLKILNNFYGSRLSNKELESVASEIGKDVPFFLSPRDAAFLDRMGDRIKKNISLPKLNYVVVNPGIHIATPWAFGEMHKQGNLGNKGLSVKMLRFVREGNIDKIIAGLHNDFEPVMEKKYPIIKKIKKKLMDLGAAGSLMTGSGSTVFGIFKNNKKAWEAKREIKRCYSDFFVKIG